MRLGVSTWLLPPESQLQTFNELQTESVVSGSESGLSCELSRPISVISRRVRVCQCPCVCAQLPVESYELVRFSR